MNRWQLLYAGWKQGWRDSRRSEGVAAAGVILGGAVALFFLQIS